MKTRLRILSFPALVSCLWLPFTIPAILYAGDAPGTPSNNAAVATSTNKAAAIENVRAILGKWLEIQQTIAREQRDWQQGREVLQSRIEIVRREVAELDERLAKARQKLDEAEKAKNAIAVETVALKESAAKLAETAGQFEGLVRTLHAQMPEPFLPRVQQLYARMPADATNSRVSIAERFQNVLGIVNEMNKFNLEIPLSYEVRNLSDGKPAEVKAFYVGLAQAYFVSASGEAGVGVPGEKGWTWQSRNDEAEHVRQAIGILQNKGSPAFVPLSMELK